MNPQHDDAPAEVKTTRERLLQAAGEVFAEMGFHDAKVRDICARAGANLASVNYYFRDKDSLYAAVIENARQFEFDQFPLDMLGPGASPHERLRAFITRFVNKLFDRGRPSWHVQLVCREMIEPTAGLDLIVERGIRPQFEYLASILGEILGPAADPHLVARCAASVIGQCLHYFHCAEVTRRLFPGFMESPDFREQTAGHIHEFTMHALEGLRQSLRSARPGAPGGAER